ncbi:hypothetical protein BGZ76_003075, partial [Entomortierella beljakovae]
MLDNQEAYHVCSFNPTPPTCPFLHDILTFRADGCVIGRNVRNERLSLEDMTSTLLVKEVINKYKSLIHETMQNEDEDDDDSDDEDIEKSDEESVKESDEEGVLEVDEQEEVGREDDDDDDSDDDSDDDNDDNNDNGNEDEQGGEDDVDETADENQREIIWISG